MKKILFLAESVSLAHIGRPLKLATWAFTAGYEVHFAYSAKGIKVPDCENLPFPSYDLPGIEPKLFYQRLQQGKFPYTLPELQAYLKEDMQLIKKMQPDFIVSDFRLTSALAGEITKTPTAQISNLHWSSTSECKFLPDVSSSLHQLPFGLGEKFFDLIRPIAFRKFANPLRRLRKMLKLPTIKDFRDLYTGSDYTLFADMPHFTETKELPSRHKVLGPILWAPESQNQEAFKIDANKKYIYITIGSSGKASIIKNLIKSLLGTSYSFIVTGISKEESKQWDLEASILEERCLFFPIANPNHFLKQCHLTICHGGSGTVYQSLFMGVPVFCLPSNPDQYLVSQGLAKNHLGQFLFKKNPSLSELTTAILKVLNNSSILHRCEEYALEMKQQNTKANWLMFLASQNFTQKDLRTVTTRRISAKKRLPSAVSQVIAQTYAEENLKPASSDEFSAEIVTKEEDRKAVFRLAYQIYKEKGYAETNKEEMLILPYDDIFDTTIIAVKNKKGQVIGSFTLVFDESTTLPSAAIFGEEIQALKDRQEKIVECSRLVIDPQFRNSKEVVQVMFNYLAVYIYHVRKVTSLIIEVNPRHQKFYETILSFTPLGAEKSCPLVQNAPAVLMHLEMSTYRQQLEHYMDLRASHIPYKSRSLYSVFMDTADELILAEKLKEQFEFNVYKQWFTKNESRFQESGFTPLTNL